MSGQASKKPDVIWLVEYQKLNNNGQPVGRVEPRIYVRNMDVAKAVVDGNAVGYIHRYVTNGTDRGMNWGDRLRIIAAQWSTHAEKRKAVNIALHGSAPGGVLPEVKTEYKPDEVEDFLAT